MFCEDPSQAKEMPLVGELDVGLGPKVNECCGAGLSLPPHIFIRVNLMKMVSRATSLDGTGSIHMRSSSDKVDVLKEVLQKEISSLRERKG